MQGYEQHASDGENIFSEHEDIVHSAWCLSYPQKSVLAFWIRSHMLSTFLQEWMFTSCVENQVEKPMFHVREWLKVAR